MKRKELAAAAVCSVIAAALLSTQLWSTDDVAESRTVAPEASVSVEPPVPSAAGRTGLPDNLLDRAASGTLKERRRLVVVPREMPFSTIDLRNALRLAESGAIICPAAPGFYMKPQRIDDLVDFVVGKVMDLLGVEHHLNTRWEQQLASRMDQTEENRA